MSVSPLCQQLHLLLQAAHNIQQLVLHTRKQRSIAHDIQRHLPLLQPRQHHLRRAPQLQRRRHIASSLHRPRTPTAGAGRDFMKFAQRALALRRARALRSQPFRSTYLGGNQAGRAKSRRGKALQRRRTR